MITVRIPATSANLGCGFDCVGIALTRYMYVSFEEIKSGIEWEGVEARYQNENNLIYRALQNGLKHIGKSISGVKISVKDPLPVSRGLGSSSACIVAGLYGAYALTDTPLDKDEILAIATGMEGHPDNVSPAIFGGLQASSMIGDKVYHSSYFVDPRFVFLTMVPNVPVSTAQARKVLPPMVDFHSAVNTLGRLGVTLKAWETYDTELLNQCMKDWLHEPYRAQLIPEFSKVRSICEEIDSICFTISGSGSTLLNVMKDASNATLIQSELDKLNNIWTATVCQCDLEGAKLC